MIPSYLGLMQMCLKVPNHEIQAQSISLDGELPMRPGFSTTLAEDMWLQVLAGISEPAKLGKHPELWNGHPFEGLELGTRRLNTLRANRDTRRAVITLPPPYCWTALHLLRDHLICYQRSCDIWLGMPYDAYLLWEIGEYTQTNQITWFIGSLHLYERDIDKVKTLL